ncbi:MAG: GyrI-like domain-containing protein [Bacteroidota bacterium]|nr:GyrI-like domain-containing protein [Bacteroidota bacterium]
MNKIEKKGFKLIGVALKTKTFNAKGQSAIDCGNLWQTFGQENYAEKIPGKVSNEVFAVYHDYEGDHTKPYSYFIGCKVKDDTEVPAGMDSLIIPAGEYQLFIAKGKMPDCIGNAWRKIWDSVIPRSYKADFEVYDEKSKDWNNAEVDIFISVK